MEVVVISALHVFRVVLINVIHVPTLQETQLIVFVIVKLGIIIVGQVHNVYNAITLV